MLEQQELGRRADRAEQEDGRENPAEPGAVVHQLIVT
jgi:hypothetical protein